MLRAAVLKGSSGHPQLSQRSTSMLRTRLTSLMATTVSCTVVPMGTTRVDWMLVVLALVEKARREDSSSDVAISRRASRECACSVWVRQSTLAAACRLPCKLSFCNFRISRLLSELPCKIKLRMSSWQDDSRDDRRTESLLHSLPSVESLERCEEADENCGDRLGRLGRWHRLQSLRGILSNK
jgi:hypothetical protein